MFSYLKGIVAKIDASTLVLDVNGIGFLLNVPSGVVSKLKAYQEVLLPVVILLRENGIDIYGFENEEQKILFNNLLQINGIGPKVALSLISTMSVADFLSAVNNNDYKLIAQSPGIGKKLAQRIVLEFRNKMGKDTELSALLSPSKDSYSEGDDVYQAMLTMGCSSSEAKQASNYAKKELGEDAPVEDLIRKALEFIKRGKF